MLRGVSARSFMLPMLILNACVAATANADTSHPGFQLEVGTYAETTRQLAHFYSSNGMTSTTTAGPTSGPVPWTAGGQVRLELWGPGPFGALFRLDGKRDFGFLDVNIFGDVPPNYQPVNSDTLQLDLAPAVHRFAGPLHLRLAAGVTVPLTRSSNATLETLGNYGLSMSWDEAVSIGGFADLRGDIAIKKFTLSLIPRLEATRSVLLARRTENLFPDYPETVPGNYQMQEFALELTLGAGMQITSALQLGASITGNYLIHKLAYSDPDPSNKTGNFISTSITEAFKGALWLRYER